MLPLAGLLGTLVRSQVGKFVAARTAGATLAKPTGPGSLLTAVGSTNPVGQNTRINLAPQFGSQPAAKPQPIPQPTFLQRASGKFREMLGQSPQQQRPAQQPVTQNAAVASSGQRFGDVLGGRMTPQEAQGDATKERDSKSSEAVGSLFSDVASSLKSAAFGPAGLVAAFVGTALAGKKFAERLNDANRVMAAHSGQIATAFAKSDMADLRRNRQSAGATAGTTTELTQAVSAMRDASRPVNDLMANVKNSLATLGAKVVTPVIKIASDLAELLSFFKSQEPQANPAQAWINDMANQYRREYAERKDRRRRMPGETVD